jgi:general secretion pathway protein A
MLGAGVSLRIQPVPRGPIVNEDFFGLRENPFSLTPNPRFLHRTRHAHETLGRITRGILDRKGLILLTGDVGTGKTTLLYTALHLLDGNPAVQHKIGTAVIVHPTLTREEFLEAVLDEFDVPCGSTRRQARLEALLKMLLDVRRKGGLAVLVIDEAQMLTGELLEEIRTLLELQTCREKLLQIILCGQPAIEAKIDLLNQSSDKPIEAVRCSAMPLSVEETRDYVQHRLRIAGARSDGIFLAESVDRIHERSGGIPRLVNLLCAQGLSVAASRQTARVSPRMIEDAAARICARTQAPRHRALAALDTTNLDTEGSLVAEPVVAGISPSPVDAGETAPTTVSIRTARRQRKAARRARIAQAKRAQINVQQIANRVREADVVTPLPQPVVAVLVPSLKREPAEKLSIREVSSSLLGWNQRLNRWFSEEFTGKSWGRRLFQLGLAGTLFLAAAQFIGVGSPEQHMVHVTFGFMGMLFIDISLGLGTYLLLLGKGLLPGTRADWAQAVLDSWGTVRRRLG